MPKPNRIYALNVGSQRVTLAEFQATSAGGLVLSNYRMDELPVESLDSEGRDKLLEAAIHGMLGQLGLKSVRLNYAVSGQSVFTRFVRLPSVEPEKVDQIIHFEAQQNVPFPIQEVVWDYQLVGSGDEGQVEVVLVAIKSDLLEGLNASIEAGGVEAEVVDVAPMALYNAFRYNYGDPAGCSLLIDIGAKTTNLIFCEPGKVFSRSIPIGGSSITSAVAKELKITETEAETLKRDEGFVSLGGAYADPEDPRIARLAKLARNTLTRLHAEVNRSISFYKAQQRGSQPTRIHLAGGAVNMPYMREFFSEKLQMPIEYLNPLRNVAVGSRVDSKTAATQAHMLAEVVGLGLRSLSGCPMELNLSPQSVIKAQEMKARQPFIVLSCVCLLLTLLGWWGYLSKASTIKGEVLGRMQSKVAELRGYERSVKRVESEIETLRRTATPFVNASRARQFWAATLGALNDCLPERSIWVTELVPLSRSGGSTEEIVPQSSGDSARRRSERPDRPMPPGAAPPGEPLINALRIRGLYLENPRQATVVDMFVNALADSESFANPKVITRTTPTGEQWAYDYELEVEITNPIQTK